MKRGTTRRLGKVKNTEHIMHEIKTICREFTVVGRESVLCSEEKGKGEDEEACRRLSYR